MEEATQGQVMHDDAGFLPCQMREQSEPLKRKKGEKERDMRISKNRVCIIETKIVKK